MFGLREWRRRRVLKHTILPEELWRAGLRAVPLCVGFSAEELRRLRALVLLFLYEKSIEGARGVEVTDEMRLVIAIQCCIPILNLSLDYYDTWVSVIVYPDAFVPRRQYMDTAGVVHTAHIPLTGEAWSRGPMILSWPDVQESAEFPDDGWNVVFHECAHKLDMLNGSANGMPPLHKEMDILAWTRDWTEAYEVFCARVGQGGGAWLDPYATENPGEFFAVLSEAFFEIPDKVKEDLPLLYNHLRTFYRQDPAARRILPRR